MTHAQGWLRAIPESFCPTALGDIDRTLQAIRAEHDVAIPLAIESGSRAWGFPSLDSDYDCRFIFIRPTAQYLSLWPVRDVIEVPLTQELDINGWDLAKAVRLLLKGNVAVMEWLSSPIIYGADATFRARFLALAHRVCNRTLVARHYLHLGEKQYDRHCGMQVHDLRIKKLFYALRPAIALRWLRLHPACNVVPMHFPSLLGECELEPATVGIIDDLIRAKAQTRETRLIAMPEPLEWLMAHEFALAHETFDHLSPEVPADAMAEADEFFRAQLGGK
ncbi:nucleotidyltransferase domain-containing protein [Gluconacetobacter entanii]|uniref:Nucleotidyltransferase n=1 Tax=Gluconacetobacter entanii TaxID=108528 RepID=A0A318QE26_9PROT|nr:nucleotidyltransferase domain-containing protein [Gluconacetobacter entanii]MBE7619235.1 nucleotidyltransferase domain-containing protein [Komagataeibacter sp. FXV2]MCE2577691.1 nucleotidyltransferase domain-containing protein [Komagataeibacter sp. FNDCR1]PYD64217.1 nucleotidyltransferase [Gluconacetobacter entanii]